VLSLSLENAVLNLLVLVNLIIAVAVTLVDVVIVAIGETSQGKRGEAS
jgi:Mn2+/Fe2+ NRAMP family transporter